MSRRHLQAAKSLALCLACVTGHAARAGPITPVVSTSARVTLYLELSINGEDRGCVIKLTQVGPTLLASPMDLQRAGIASAGLTTNAQGQVVLSAVKTFRVEIDRPKQTIDFQIDPKDLAPNLVPLHNGFAVDQAPNAENTGTYLNYNLSGVDSAGVQQLAGQFAANIFSPYGDIRSAFQTNVQSKNQPSSPPDFIRLGTAYEYDWPAVPRSLIVGDFISDSLPWTRAQFVGGIQIETNYDLQPGAITFPVPTSSTTLAAPSAVNLLVNNVSSYQGNQQAGPFSVVGIPVLTGLNEITVQTRAPDGQIVSSTVPFYASNDLLKPGLTAYALNIGELRHDYGSNGDGYADLSGSGTFRHGLTDHLTIDLHAEAAGNVQMGGASLDTTSILGEIDGTVAASNRLGRHAGLVSANWIRTTRVVSFSFGTTYAQNGFADLGTDLGLAYPHFSWYASASTTLPNRLGSVSLAYTSEQLDQSSRSQFLIGSYNVTTFYGISASASLFLGNSDASGASSMNRGFDLAFNIPLGRNFQASSSAQGTNGEKTDITETLTRELDPDGGYGWSVSNENGQNNNQSATGQLYTHDGNFTGSLQRYDGQTDAQATASGSVVLLDGLHLSSPAYQSFGVVDVGYPNVPVYLENRPIGTTGSNGTLLIQNLQPYALNKISIDATKLPLSVNLANENTVLTPPMNGGVVAQFPLNHARYRMLQIETANGSYPAPGSLLELAGATGPMVIGYDGEVQLENPGRKISGKVIMRNGTCMVSGRLPPETRLNDMEGVAFKCL